MMAVQSNPYQHLPLTITPVLHSDNANAVSQVTPLLKQTSKPDLTFHCICCKSYFMSPLLLYQHMNIEHAEQTATSTTSSKSKPGSIYMDHDADECDYSWVFEPVCELLTEDSDSDSDTDKSNDSESTTSSSSDDDATTSSSSSTSGTSDTNTNTEERQVDTPLESTSNCQDTDEVTCGEVEDASNPITTTSSSASSLGDRDIGYPNEVKLKLADMRESTSIILLNPRTSDSSLLVNATHLVEKVSIDQSESPSQKQTSMPLVQGTKPRRGRRSTVPNVSAFMGKEQKCFQCSHCEASFPNAGDLSKHVRSHITNKPFQCSICQKTFTHIGSLNTHIRIHSGEKPYKCQLCVKAFTQSSSLMVHLRSHTVRKPYQCDKCDKGFINHSSLVMHKKTHRSTEIFVCPECEKEFKQESLLDEHMRMHTQEFVYQCSICRQAFRSSSELVQHMKCHLGEKPFTCSICDRSFTQSGSLNIHMRIHTGEKPFHCKLCDKSFTQASSLSVHMKIHTGDKPFPCHICGKSYSQQAYLNKHIQAHLAEGEQKQRLGQQESETLVCIVCGSLHKDATSLALHVTQQHRELLNNLKHDETIETMQSKGKTTEVQLNVEQQQQQYLQRVHALFEQQQQYKLEEELHNQKLQQQLNKKSENINLPKKNFNIRNTDVSLKNEIISNDEETEEDVTNEEMEMQKSKIYDSSSIKEVTGNEDFEIEKVYLNQYLRTNTQMDVNYEIQLEDYAAEEEVYTENN